MKKTLLVFMALILLSGSVSAAPALIGVYVDETHTTCRYDLYAPYVPFNSWVWVMPGDNGLICAEFRVEFPAWLLNTNIIRNGVISVALGDPITGASACFTSCQTDWNWVYQMSFLPTMVLAGHIDIVEHPDVAAIQAANCLPGYPIEPLIVLNNLGINQDCEVTVANKASSWGAIKDMYGE